MLMPMKHFIIRADDSRALGRRYEIEHDKLYFPRLYLHEIITRFYLERSTYRMISQTHDGAVMVSHF